MKLHKKHINHFKHILIFLLIGFISLIFILYIGNIYYEKINPTTSSIQYGVTFSNTYTKFLGLDWKETYLDILTNLQVKNLRIPAYWEVVEPQENKYIFPDIDFMLDNAAKNNARVILVLGLKQPRWPECHMPEWAKELSVKERQEKVFDFIEKVVVRYKDHPAISAWQVENEPLLSFGSRLCDTPDRIFLRNEVKLVKQLDSKHPIILTDSGELRLWVTPMQLGDIMGTTLYRSVYNEIFGYFYYPLPPAFYSFKSNLIRKVFAPNNRKTIIVELQTEPWSPSGVPSFPIEEQLKVFSLEDFKNNVSFAQKTGFEGIYLWGVEWWYYMAKHNHPEYLETAKELFIHR